MRLPLVAFALLACLVHPTAPAQPATPAEPAPAQPATAAPPAALARFDVYEFVVEGNSVLDRATIEATVYPFLGDAKTIDDVQAARAALEAVYRAKGYQTVLVEVPEQRVDQRVVRLNVVEAPVGRLRVRNARYVEPATLKALLPSVAEGEVPSFPKLERDLALLSRTGLTTVTPSLRPGRTPGTIDIDLSVDDKRPWDFNVDLNNQAAVNTKPWRLTAGARYTNLWDRRHTIGAQWQTAPQAPSQVDVFSLNYTMPLGTPEDPALAFYAVRSGSETPTSIGGLSVVGRQHIAGLRWVQPLPGAEGFNHYFTLGADRKRLLQSELTGSGGNSEVDYTPFTVGWTAIAATASMTRSADFTAQFSLRGLGNDQDQFRFRRYLADASYLWLRADLGQEQRLAAWTLKSRLAGQYASGPLIPSEQYVLGGAASVRAYRESEQLGDKGLLGSIELRSPNLPAPSTWMLNGLAFVEGGAVRIDEPLPAQRASFVLLGAGLGFRLRLSRALSASLDWAHALRSATFTKSGDNRLYGRILAEF
jgi:hemolysin activation/secretion protein